MHTLLPLLLICCFLTVSLSFLCSLTEAVLLSLNPLALQIHSARGESHAAQWLMWKKNIERPVSALLVWNTIANTGLATCAGAIFAHIFGGHLLWAFTLGIFLLVLFLGELMPKIIGVQRAETLAIKLRKPLSLLILTTMPLVKIMEHFCALFKREDSTAPARHSRILDIVTLVESARAEQAIHSTEEIIIIHAATLSARRIHTAMVPAESVLVFHLGQSLKENLKRLSPKLHRSYPVSKDGTYQNITGYIRIRDVMAQKILQPDNHDWKSFVRPSLHIDSRMSLTQLLALFLEKKEIAAVVDQNDTNLVGWITLDDVFKVLTGERV